MNALTKYLKHKTFILLGILAAIVSLASVLINFDLFSSAESTEDTPFNERLRPILSDFGFPHEQVLSIEGELVTILRHV